MFLSGSIKLARIALGLFVAEVIYLITIRIIVGKNINPVFKNKIYQFPKFSNVVKHLNPNFICNSGYRCGFNLDVALNV